MSRHAGMYDHLNADDPPVIPLTMSALVKRIREMNYGEHRFLSELLKQREASRDDERDPEHRAHTALLRTMLQNGYY
jgi:hypothetical protein